ncbi:cation diffusion facilitator family transporter [Agromyces bauzanensis]
MTGPVDARRGPSGLYRFMYLSIGAAILTIALKAAAALITGSVGLLSDALESSVNLVAAVLALIVLQVAVRPPDPSHQFGHGQAEYLSVMAEGAMIVIAAAAIIWSALQRLLHPAPLDLPGLGLVLATAASVVNLVVGLVLLRVGRRRRSMTLVADGKHLMTDVWTSVGVLVGIALVALTGWVVLDPIIALVVGANILWTGYRLLRRSASGLLSRAIPPAERQLVEDALTRFAVAHGVEFGPLRTVELGRRRLIQAVMRVPGDWTVDAAHDLAGELEGDLEALLPETETIVHVEPRQAVAPDVGR